MIVTAAPPRTGDRVQGGDLGQHVGRFSRFNVPADRIWCIELDDGRTAYPPRETVFVLTERLISVADPDDPLGPPAWEGPIERATETFDYGRYPGDSEDAAGVHHEGGLVVGIQGAGAGLADSRGALVASWECAASCACQPFESVG